MTAMKLFKHLLCLLLNHVVPDGSVRHFQRFRTGRCRLCGEPVIGWKDDPTWDVDPFAISAHAAPAQPSWRSTGQE